MSSTLDAVLAVAREGRLYPAVILHGGDGVGRREAAVLLGRILLCEVPAADRPCGSCRHCRRIVWPEGGGEAFHADFQVLQRDLRTATSVGATKAFLQVSQVAPFEARGQVFVVASAETLTGEAANALLKTLEEPPDRSPRHFLLLCPSPFDLPSTVRSRSLAVYLGPPESTDDDAIERIALEFGSAVGAFRSSGQAVHLLAAARSLASAGGWQDPRATGPWKLAAAAVLRSLELDAVRGARRGAILALAEDLLDGPRLRVRGIGPERILEGLVVRRLVA